MVQENVLEKNPKSQMINYKQIPISKIQIPNKKVSGQGYGWIIEKLNIEICMGFDFCGLAFQQTVFCFNSKFLNRKDWLYKGNNIGIF